MKATTVPCLKLHRLSLALFPRPTPSEYNKAKTTKAQAYDLGFYLYVNP